MADTTTKAAESLAAVEAAFGKLPRTLVIAGSGLGGFAKTLANAKTLSYSEIPHFPQSAVVGHAGALVVGEAGGRRVAVMNGRKHLYEGVAVEVSVHPLRTLLAGGVRTVIVSNAAGSLNPRFDVGDLVLLSDHINGMFQNPLIGKNDDAAGPRFPDMSEPYSRRLRQVAREAAAALGITLREGVYWGGLGPSYETRAEVQMLRQFADVVGMSTVPETIVAVHAGAEVLGISCATNSLVLSAEKTTHDEVIEVGRAAGERFSALVAEILRRLGD
ncbi:MAG: purine-nucleoside phosphorylase [Candidatus Sumerlaeia bacterium]|nr:purine-nucleoside phosphorylase [Candidatus Sumerlaeia bacterium]